MNHSILGSKGMYNHLSQPPSIYSDTFQSQRLRHEKFLAMDRNGYESHVRIQENLLKVLLYSKSICNSNLSNLV